MDRGNVPVYAPNLDTNICPKHSVAERSNLLIIPQRKSRRSNVSAVHPLFRPEIVVQAHATKGQKNHDLKRDARDDGLVPGVDQLPVLAAPACRQRAANGLDEKAAHVCGDENEGKPLWPDPREGRVQRSSEVLERQIYRDAGQSRSEHNGAYLGLKGLLVPGVIGEGDASGVAY